MCGWVKTIGKRYVDAGAHQILMGSWWTGISFVEVKKSVSKSEGKRVGSG